MVELRPQATHLSLSNIVQPRCARMQLRASSYNRQGISLNGHVDFNEWVETSHLKSRMKRTFPTFQFLLGLGALD